MRYFNTSGPNIPTEHYTLPRLNLIEQGKKMVHNNRYFTICEVLEDDEMIEDVQIKTYLVRYDLEKDFTLPRKQKAPKKKTEKG